MKRSIKIFVAVVFVALLSTAIALAGGYQINEHGARAMGMGGAFVAQASDASAIFFNPAGLAYQKGINVMLGTTLIAPSTEFKGPTPLTTTTKMESQVFFPSNAYVTYGMDNGFSFGVGFFNPYGLGTDWKKLPTGFPGVTFDMKTDLRTYYINPSVAYRFSEQLSIGVGVSYVLGSLEIMMPQGTALLDSDVATGSGVSFNGGILYKPTKKLSIGVSYRSMTEIEFEGDAKLSGVLPTPITGKAKAKLPMPDNLMAGISYAISPDFTVEAAFQYVGWKSYDMLEATVVFPAPVGSVVLNDTVDWDNSFLLRLGGEYRMEKLALRAGFVYDASPQPDKAVNPQLPDANRIEIVVGAGYHFSEMLTVDAAFQFINSAERTVTAPTNSYPGTYNSTALLFGVNLGLHF